MVRGAWLYSELTSVRGGNNCGELRVLKAVSNVRLRVWRADSAMVRGAWRSRRRLRGTG